MQIGEQVIVFEKDNIVASKINTFLKERISDSTSEFIVREVRTIEELSSVIVLYYYGYKKEYK